jgi:hypothetical protein
MLVTCLNIVYSIMARNVDIGVYYYSYDFMNVCAVHDVELQACYIYCCVQLTFRLMCA